MLKRTKLSILRTALNLVQAFIGRFRDCLYGVVTSADTRQLTGFGDDDDGQDDENAEKVRQRKISDLVQEVLDKTPRHRVQDRLPEGPT
jgi:hypothetical protein